MPYMTDMNTGDYVPQGASYPLFDYVPMRDESAASDGDTATLPTGLTVSSGTATVSVTNGNRRLVLTTGTSTDDTAALDFTIPANAFGAVHFEACGFQFDEATVAFRFGIWDYGGSARNAYLYQDSSDTGDDARYAWLQVGSANKAQTKALNIIAQGNPQSNNANNWEQRKTLQLVIFKDENRAYILMNDAIYGTHADSSFAHPSADVSLHLMVQTNTAAARTLTLDRLRAWAETN